MRHDEILAELKTRPDIAPYAFLVGRWVWIAFPSRPALETRQWLKANGFHWNKERGCWQHPMGYFSAKAPYDPRTKYPTLTLEEVDA